MANNSISSVKDDVFISENDTTTYFSFDTTLQSIFTYFSSITNLPDEEWSSFLSILEYKHVDKNEHIQHEGQLLGDQFFIAKGFFLCYYENEEQHFIKDFYSELTPIFATMNPIMKLPALYNIVAIEKSEILYIPSHKSVELFCSHNCWQDISRAAAEQRFSYSEKKDLYTRTKSIEEQYSYLLEHQPDILERAKHYQIASYLGISPETFSRFRKKML
ncbi:MAG: Crp/Fnr family transcriptional regulator [Candidatus Kapabacteria bacterium]|nr:Crp/Fnr family transcriptional regulator [Candidatus Kapabacteria bacterium]